MLVFQMGRQEHVAAEVTPCKPCRTWGVSCRGPSQPLGSEEAQPQLAGRKWGAGETEGKEVAASFWLGDSKGAESNQVQEASSFLKL